jgi:hypothetical protein
MVRRAAASLWYLQQVSEVETTGGAVPICHWSQLRFEEKYS